ncbi:hypothetical protein OAU29_01525 [Porticoccaceae bacterium]|jgi:hypothetical protein|nr:hypothetical protein [Porticoccaceae bacterium]MDB2395181.1 hypothetical protein [Porticoccaceae bacterium]MDC3258912.1 hypothetical protein [Porticoccaceae bacterium]
MTKPNLFRRSTMLMVYIWRRVMDVKFNPLKYIPDASLQAYFMVVLFSLWSVSFGFIATYYIGWLGYSTLTSLAVHLSILVPIVVTNAVFVDAERTGEKWLEEWKEERSRYALVANRLKAKNMVPWELNKEA